MKAVLIVRRSQTACGTARPLQRRCCSRRRRGSRPTRHPTLHPHSIQHAITAYAGGEGHTIVGLHAYVLRLRDRNLSFETVFPDMCGGDKHVRLRPSEDFPGDDVSRAVPALRAPSWSDSCCACHAEVLTSSPRLNCAEEHGRLVDGGKGRGACLRAVEGNVRNGLRIAVPCRRLKGAVVLVRYPVSEVSVGGRGGERTSISESTRSSPPRAAA